MQKLTIFVFSIFVLIIPVSGERNRQVSVLFDNRSGIELASETGEEITLANVAQLEIIATPLQNQRFVPLVLYNDRLIYTKRYIGDDTRIYHFDPSDSPFQQISSSMNSIREISQGHNGLVLALYDEQDISIWDTGASKEPKVLMEAPNRGLVSALNSQGTRFAFVIRPPGDDIAFPIGEAQYIHIWNLETERMLTFRHEHEKEAPFLFFHPDGKTLFSTDGQTVKQWDAETGTELRTFQFSTFTWGYDVFNLSAEGDLLAARAENSIELWNLAENSEAPLILKHDYNHIFYQMSMDFDSSGTLLASGGADGVKLWNTETGEEIATLVHGNSTWVFDVAFSPNNELLASGGQDGTIRIWSVETGDELAVLNGHTTPVWDVTFSDDGTLLISKGQGDGTLHLWGIPVKND